MNYFAHALPFLDSDPHFLAGTAVPDWMSVADRPVRVRAKLAAPLAEQAGDPAVQQVALGALQHFRDDDWFHGTRGFVELTSDVARRFRECLGPADPMRCGFLGHVVTELLLDAALMERHSGGLDRYYARLREVDPLLIQRAVNQMARGETQRLSLLIPYFIEERFLADYATNAGLLARLNGVLRRVTLTPLPEAALAVLADARGLIAGRLRELLPPEHYSGRYTA